MRKPIDETLVEIRKRYAAKDGQEITQLMRDVSYLFMVIRQREHEVTDATPRLQSLLEKAT